MSLAPSVTLPSTVSGAAAHAPTALCTMTFTQGAIDAAFTPSGSALVGVARSGEVIAYDIDAARTLNTQQRTLTNLGTSLYGIAFLPDESAVVLSDANGTVHMLAYPSMSVINQITQHTSFVWGVRVHPSGAYCVSTAADGQAIFYDLQLSSPLNVIHNKSGMENCEFRAEFTHDAQFVLLADAAHNISVCSATAPFSQVSSISGHTSSVRALAITSDDQIVLSLSLDLTVMVSSIPGAMTLCKLTVPDIYPWALSLSPDDSTFFVHTSGNQQPTLYTYELGSALTDPSNAAQYITCVGADTTSATSYAYALPVAPQGDLMAAPADSSTMTVLQFSPPFSPVPVRHAGAPLSLVALLTSGEDSDIRVRVVPASGDAVEFRAHRFVLARSELIKGLLSGTPAADGSILTLTEAGLVLRAHTVAAGSAFLRYLYSDMPEEVVDTLSPADALSVLGIGATLNENNLCQWAQRRLLPAKGSADSSTVVEVINRAFAEQFDDSVGKLLKDMAHSLLHANKMQVDFEHLVGTLAPPATLFVLVGLTKQPMPASLVLSRLQLKSAKVLSEHMGMCLEQAEQFGDVRLESSHGGVMHVHRAVLGARSRFFADLLASAPGTNVTIVDTQSPSFEYMQALVSVLYTGSFPSTTSADVATTMIGCGTKYGLEPSASRELDHQVFEHMRHSLSASTAVEIAMSALRAGALNLLDSVLTYIGAHLLEIAHHEFNARPKPSVLLMDLPEERLGALIDSLKLDDLRVLAKLKFNVPLRSFDFGRDTGHGTRVYGDNTPMPFDADIFPNMGDDAGDDVDL